MTALSEHPCDAAPAPMYLARLVQFIEEHLPERLSIPDLALEAGISPFHFVRLFKQATGLTPHQYVVSRRVERARQLLADEVLSIAAIALDTGFASQSHLTEVFRRQTGVTPAVYRSCCGEQHEWNEGRAVTVMERGTVGPIRVSRTRQMTGS